MVVLQFVVDSYIGEDRSWFAGRSHSLVMGVDGSFVVVVFVAVSVVAAAVAIRGAWQLVEFVGDAYFVSSVARDRRLAAEL